MPITLTCSGCSGLMKAPDSAAGKRVKCPKCATILTVPTNGEADDAPARVTERPAPPAPVGRTRPDEDRDEEREPRTARGPEERYEEDDRPRRSLRRRDREEEDEDAPRFKRQEDSGGSGVALGLGIASLVCAVLALPVALFPCTSVFSFAVSGLGLLLGLIGGVIAAVNQWRGIAFPIAGTVVSVLAIGIAALWVFVFVGMVSSTGRAVQQAQQAAQQMQKQAEQAQKAAEDRERLTLLAQGWSDASSGPVKVGNVAEVRISLRLDTVSFERADIDPGLRTRKYLQVVVTVRNISDRDLAYTSWSQSSKFGNPNAPRLNGNTGEIINFANFGPRGDVFVLGQSRNTTIRRGEEVSDLLVFEKPFLQPSHLRLELPGTGVGVPGQTVRFFVPRSMVPR